MVSVKYKTNKVHLSKIFLIFSFSTIIDYCFNITILFKEQAEKQKIERKRRKEKSKERKKEELASIKQGKKPFYLKKCGFC